MQRCMLQLLVALIAVSLLSCSDKKQEKSRPMATVNTKKVNLKSNDGGKLLDKSQEEQKKRKALVKKELGECDLYLVKHSAKSLSEKDRPLALELLAAGELVGTLNKLMISPHNLEYEKTIQDKGTADDKELFRRNQQPWCVDIEDPACCAMSPCPKKQVGAYLWPPDMTDADFKAISKAGNKEALLSPFTVVRRAGKGFKAIAYAGAPLFKPYMVRIAAHLRKAAKITDDPSLKKFLNSRADAFESSSTFPYDASDYDWIGLKGAWDLTIGPYEVYKNPRQTKARFEFVLGRVDTKVTAQLDKFRSRLQEMEGYLAKLVGPKVYKGRKLNPKIAIRAIDVWMAAGDARNPQGVVAAYHLPNRGKAVDEGLYKKVLLINHMRAFNNVMKRRAQLMLDQKQLKYVDPEADIFNTTFHEFSHGFGAYDELEVKTKSGAVKTVHGALQEFSSLLEEEKADVFSLYFVPIFVKKGWITQEDAKKRYVSSLMHLIGLMQYNLKGTYPRMVSVQLGWYLNNGGVTFDKATGRLHVNFDKIGPAVKSLARTVATIQLTGDYEGAVRLVGRYVLTKDKVVTLSPVLQKIHDLSKTRFAKAGIKTLTMKYEITDL